ncbi:MAG TPA: GNAT family N-acetyltransferase [Longimicrobium sp.]|nr:GNAT family N-acetyltransferase [Longimicrobium sp.]
MLPPPAAPDSGTRNPHLAAALAAAAERIPPQRVDAVWLFPARQLGARESGLAVLSVFAEGDEARRTRTIHTVRYVVEPQAGGKAARADAVEEQGTVPLDRVERIIEGVLRRLDVPETPDVRETGGDAGRWAELLAELGGVPLGHVEPPAAPAEAESAGPLIRVATEADVSEMHRIRLAVRENRLADPDAVQPHHTRAMITDNGRGWVAEMDGRIAGFAVADLARGNVWALFVDPELEGRGIGRRLHDEMMGWFFAQGVERVWLSTDPGTRAEAFYRAAGWQQAGEYRGEARYEMGRDQWLARVAPGGVPVGSEAPAASDAGGAAG